ncbi:MAG TPA: dienelactone hydrolase family protein [Bryobacteraceae bacterium]|nr:dienelactone hydrolase family protein [Bryobacteraceae bacterium]
MNQPRPLPGSTGVAIQHFSVTVPVDSVRLDGALSVPAAASGVVLFAHGSGSSRHSPRNRYVADLLNESRLATLLIDLLTADEQEVDLQTAQLRFDIPFLAKRLVAISEWLGKKHEIAGLAIGHFGASTGAGAALVAAAEIPGLVRAVVSRGGRPDLAGRALARVEASTLLIVGGADPVVLDLNRKAMAQMHCEKQLQIIPGAGHLFEEPGALQQVAGLARDWFAAKLLLPGSDDRAHD